MSYYIPSQKSYQLLYSNNLAVLSSIAIHVLVLGVVLPNTNFFGDRSFKKPLETVKVTQLTPAELNRLPILDRSENIDTLESDLDSNYQKPQDITSIYPNLPEFEPKITKHSHSSSLSGLNDVNIDALLPAPPPLKIPTTSAPPPFNFERQEKVDRVKTFEKIESQPIITSNSQPKQPTKTETTQQQIQQEERSENPFTQEENRYIRRRLLQHEIQKKAALMTKDNTNTTDEEALKNYVTWLSKIQKDKAVLTKISGTYPRDICIRKIAATVVYGVSVNSEGKAIDSHLIKSSGYKIFDIQAEEDINSQTFTAQNSLTKAYRVNVNFEPSNKVCPGLSLSN